MLEIIKSCVHKHIKNHINAEAYLNIKLENLNTSSIGKKDYQDLNYKLVFNDTDRIRLKALYERILKNTNYDKTHSIILSLSVLLISKIIDENDSHILDKLGID